MSHVTATRCLTRVSVEASGIYKWLGEDVRLRPEWGFDYDLAPDDEAHLVERARGTRETVRGTFADVPVPGKPDQKAPL